jgi:ATP-dependent helicase/nuclease subunit B
MAVEFVIGRAGTGKTQYCVDALVAQSQREPLGPPIFWLMPEQATFMSEQRLLAAPGMAGSFRIRVLGFRRLCRFLAAELNLPLGPDISPTARHLLLARAVQACRSQLTAYSQAAEYPGFLASVDRTLRELIQGRQSPRQLRATAEILRGNITPLSNSGDLFSDSGRTPECRQAPGGPADSVLINKLHDLAMLLESWDAVQPAGFVDGETLPGLIENALAGDDRLQGISVYVDAFSSMSMMEIRLLAVLAGKVNRMVITLLADPDSEAIKNPAMAPAPMGVFHRTEQLYQRLMRQLKTSGADIATPVFLQQIHRFNSAAALGHIESRLFAMRQNSPDKISAGGNVELRSCQTPEEEVLCAGRRIASLVAAGMRYRDIGVIVSDLTRYDPLIRPIFASLQIPFFLDQRQSLKFHPLVELLRGITALPREGFSCAELQSLIKTGLAGMSHERACELENYFLAHGIERDPLDADWSWDQLPTEEPLHAGSPEQHQHLKQINTARRQLRLALEPWIMLTTEAAQAHPIARYARTLLQLLVTLNAGTAMAQWINAATAAGTPELAQIHQQAWTQCRDILHEMAALPEEHTQTLRGFSDLLRTVLENLTLGLIPPALDQVLISSAQRSRHPELKVVLVIGALETLMPQAASEDAMLNDADRRRLKPLLGDALNPDAADDLLEAAFFDYVAFTRPSEKLIVSYPAADAEGRNTVPSIYIARLQALFADLNVVALESADIRWHDFAALDELIRCVLLATQHAAPRSALTAGAEQWLTACTDPAVQRRWQQALAVKHRHNIAPLPMELGRFEPGSATLSVSELETYAACSLKHFYQYTLRLQERPQWEMDARNMGIMYHQALDLFYQQVIQHQLAWPECSAQDFQAAVAHAVEGCTASLSASAIADATELQAVAQSMQRHLEHILEAQRRAARVNALRPAATELWFGPARQAQADKASELPGLVLDNIAQGAVTLRGKIDRIDIDPFNHVLLVDYKSGNKTFKLGQFVHGLDLQLVAYMLVVRDRKIHDQGPLKPIAALYYPLHPKKIAHQASRDEAPLDPKQDAYFTTCKPDGPFDHQAIPKLDNQVEAGMASAWFKIKINLDGNPAANSGMDHALFSAMLQVGLEKMRELAMAIRNGNIAPQPYKSGSTTACSYCEFKSICPFDRQRGYYHLINTTSKDARAWLQTEAQLPVEQP